MRKLLLSLALVAAVGVASAQTEQGGWIVGGASALGFSSESQDGVADNTSNIDLDVKAGYFIMDNLALGLNLGYTKTSQGDVFESGMGVGPWARYYVGGKFFLGAGYNAISIKGDDGSQEFDGSASSISLEAGYPIFLGDNVAIEPALNYNMFSGDLDGMSSFGLGVGFMIFL